MRQSKKRLYSFILILFMCFSLLPVPVTAEGEESPAESPAAEEITEQEETETEEEPEGTENPEETEVSEEPAPSEEPEPSAEPVPSEETEEAFTQGDEETPEIDDEGEPVYTQLEITVLPERLKYQVGDVVDLAGIELCARTDDEISVTVTDLDEIELISYDTAQSGVNKVRVGYAGLTAEFSIQVHTLYEHNMLLLDSDTYPQSSHSYSNSMDVRYPFAYEGAESLTLVFSGNTATESGYDYIWIYDGEENQLGKYSGTELAGQTVVVPGDRFVIRLTSDSSVTAYGFSFDSITAEIYNVEHEHTEPGVYTPSTCFDDAFTTYICSVCGEEYIVIDEDSAHHEYENGFCRLCGAPEDAVSSGKLSDTVIWAVTEEGTLYVSGTGEMPDNITWEFALDSVNSVIVGSGITRIGTYAFRNFTALTSVETASTVETIGAYAFSGCTLLSGFTVPDSVKTIENNAFYSCSGLRSVYIPDSVTSISASSYSYSPFYNCNSALVLYCGPETKPDGWGYYWNYRSSGNQLSTNYGFSAEDYSFWTSVDKSAEVFVIPEGITRIPNSAFTNLTSLTEVQIPDSVTSIGNYAFSGCTSLVSVNMPSALKTIGDYAFQNCSKLEALSLPEGLTSIGNYAFSGCKLLTEMVLPGTVESIGYRFLNGCTGVSELVLPASLTTFGYYSSNSILTGSSVKTLTVSAGVTEIPGYAFYGASALESISLPDSVVSIGAYAFYNCSSLTEISIPAGVTALPEYAFQNCSKLVSVSLPQGLTSLGRNVFYGCGSLTELTIPDGVTSIPEYAFYGCTSLSTVSFPENLTSIEADAFYNCQSLTFNSAFSSLEYIGNSAFSNCKKITEFNLPESLTSVGWCVFSGCTQLESLTIPASLTSFRRSGNNGFLTGSSVKSLVFAEGTTVIPDNVLSGASSITSVDLPETVTSIGSYAFNGCTSLTELSLPEALTNIGPYAFYNCRSLTEIVIPENVVSIPADAFYNCSSLAKAVLPEGLTSIGSYAFYGCSSLAEITLPETLTGIGQYAFYNCSSLEEISIPESVTTIPNYAFNGCVSLKTVSIPETVKTVSQYAFYNCRSLESITVPAGQNVGNYAYANCSGAKTLTIGDNAVIGNYAFSGCTGLSSAVIGNNISYGNNVFNGVVLSGECGEGAAWSLSMETGTLSVEGSYLMADYSPESPAPWNSFTSTIKTINISGTIDGIGAWAFAGCDKVQSVLIPDGVKIIGESAFRGCTGLKYLEIPDGIQSIGADAFADCTALEQVIFLGDAPSVMEDNCLGSEKSTIYYPETASGFTQRLINRFAQNAWLLWDDTVPSKDIVILLDTSGSMEGKTATLSSAAGELINSIGGAVKKTKISVVRYDSSAYTLNGFTTDPVTLQNSVASLKASGGTEYYRALSHANNLLSGRNPDIRFVIMFSDGEPTDSTSSIYALADSMRENTVIYTVGLLSSQSQRDVLINVAGSETRYFEATDIQSLVSAFIELSENFGKSEETTAEIKRHGTRHNLFTEEQTLCLNSDEMVTIYITPGTAEQYAAVDSIAIKQGGQILLRNKTGVFEGILPSAYFEKDKPVYSVLLDANGNTIEEKELLLRFRDSYTITYMWGTEGGSQFAVYTTDTFIPGTNISPPKAPKLAGYTFEGWYASITCEGYSFFHILNYFNRLYVEGDITLYPKWEEDLTTLRMGVDNWTFLNNHNSFGYGDYEITTGDYARLIDGLNESDKSSIKNDKDESWNGSCFGMSSSTVLGKEGSLEVNNFDSGSSLIGEAPIYKNTDGDNDVGSIESMINFYQLRQILGSINTIRTDWDRSDDSPNLERIINKMESVKEPVVMTIKPGGGGHAVVAFDLQKTDTGYTFQVYDCSLDVRNAFPVNVTVRDGTYTAECDEWEAEWGRQIFFKTALSADELKALPYLVAPDVLHSAASLGSPEAGYYSMNTTYGDFTISDGKNSAVISDGYKVSGELNIICYGNEAEIGYSPKYLFELPVLSAGERYEIIQSGTGTFKTTVKYSDDVNGFFAKHNANTPGTIYFGADGSVQTSYPEAVSQEISVCANRMSTPWYNVEISGISTGFNVTPGSETISVVPAEDTTVTVSANSDFNELTLTNVPVTTGGVTVLEGEDDVCEVRDAESVLAAQGLYGFSVAFDSQLGSNVPTLYNVAYGSTVEEPGDPVREGYIFQGWFKDPESSEPWDFENDTVTADTILYAGWSVNPNYIISVTFHLPGAADETVYLPKRSLISAEYAPKTSEGEEYLWYAREDFSGEPWNFAEDVAAENMVLYGKTGECRVTFETGIEQSLPVLTTHYGMTIEEPSGLVFEGHTLCSWYTDSDFTDRWDFESDTVKEDMTLYARWLENIKDKNGTDTGICIEIAEENSLVYTGKAVVPDVIVRDDGKKLTAGTDYTLSFKNNVNACDKDSSTVKASKKPQAVITGKGNYKAARKIVVYFSIRQADLGDLSVTVPELVAAKAKNKLQTIKPTVKTEIASVPASAYTVSYYTDEALSENVKGITAAGTYYVVVEAKNNNGVYTGNLTGNAGPFTVTVVESAKLLSSSAKITVPKTIRTVTEVPDEDTALRTLLTKVTVGKTAFPTDEAGIAEFKSCFDVTAVDSDGTVYAQDQLGQVLLTIGKKTLNVSAKDGNSYGFVGEKSAVVNVKGPALKKADFLVTFDPENETSVLKRGYSGLSQVPSVVTDLSEGRDYTVSYRKGKKAVSPEQIKNAGSYSLVITGKGAYSGTLTYTFNITKVNLSAAAAEGRIKAEQISQAVQDLSGAKPRYAVSFVNQNGNRIRLAEGTDYTAKYANNTTANEKASVTFTGKGNFTGSLSKKNMPELVFSIEKKSLNAPEITVSAEGITVKNGAVTGVKYSLYDGSKKIPAKEYTGTIEEGETHVTLTITANDVNYTGTRTVIVQKTLVKTGNTKKVKTSIPGGSKYYYTGSPIRPEVSVLDAEGNDISSCFTVVYGKNTGVGIGTVKIIGNPEKGYYGSKTLKITILPKWMQWLFK